MDNNSNKEKDQKQIDLTRKQVLMANERTFNSWVRSGLTAVVGGLFIARFLGEGVKSPVITAIGIIFILSSMGFYIVGYLRYKEDIERVHGKEAKRSVSTRITMTTSIALIFSSILSLALIYQYYSM
ncbi:YidH family protein [Methanobacterium oryzae]|uniref:YidH family protein n=1 Tax=Methanobacterium oryzae TaxID=69540 RepID=UPI003D1FE6F8